MKKAYCFGLAVFSALVFGSVSAFAAPVVVNGSFEANNWSPEVSNLGGSAITGWTAFQSNSNTFYLHGVSNAAPYGKTPYGNQYLVLGPTNLGGNYVEQAVSGFTIGSKDTLSFAISSECYTGNAFCGSGPHARLQVSFTSGSATPSADFLAPSSVANWWDTWQIFTYNFVPTASTVTIRLLDLGGINNGYDIGLDNVSVTEQAPVPEPSSLILLGSAVPGMAGLGLWRRMRKDRV